MAEHPTGTESQSDDIVISGIRGPVVRLATLCESVIEEVDTHTTTVVRMLDAVEYTLDEIARGDTTLPGYAAFMGYHFPGNELEVTVSILVATDEGDVIGVSPRPMRIQGPQRGFAIAVRLGALRIPRPGQYVIALAYQNQEIARSYLRVQFATPEPSTPDPDAP